MNHLELVAAVADKLGVTQRSVSEVLAEVARTVHAILSSGKTVKVSGLGNFEVKPNKARRVKNPRNQAWMQIPARKKPVLRPAEALKRAAM